MIESPMRLLIAALCFFQLIPPASANAGQDSHAVRKAIEDFLQVQTQGLPGSASYSIGTIASTERLAACQNLQVALPQGGRLWGKTNVVVRCADVPGWTLYVPVKIKVVGNYLVSSRSLRQGQSVTAEDIAVQSGDLTELPGGTLTDPQQAAGRILAASIAAGNPLRSDLLRQSLIVKQGQSVKVVSRGPGFEVANEGEALNNAASGQVVRVRLGNGQLVNGIATSDGTVNVTY